VTNPPIDTRVQHLKTGASGVVTQVSGRPDARLCKVEFSHGVEEVPQKLLRPEWDPFELLAEGSAIMSYPFDGWLRRERFRLLDAFDNDLALGLANSRVEPQLHQVSVALRALEKPQPRLILADEVRLLYEHQ
jgi:hypothetical protein